MAGGHAGPRGEWRGRHLEGPQVNGPWLEVWSGNTNVLPRPSFSTHDFVFFIPCGTMSLGNLFLQVTWQHSGRRIGSQGVHRVDSGPRDHQSSMCAYRV